MKEELEGVLSSEVVRALEKRIAADVNKQIVQLQKQVTEALEAMNKKVTDGVSYLVRHTGKLPLSIDLGDKK